MSQKLFVGALSGTGIVAVLFIIGFVLSISGINTSMGSIAIGFAIFIAIIFGFLGILGIFKKLIH